MNTEDAIVVRFEDYSKRRRAAEPVAFLGDYNEDPKFLTDLYSEIERRVDARVDAKISAAIEETLTFQSLKLRIVSSDWAAYERRAVLSAKAMKLRSLPHASYHSDQGDLLTVSRIRKSSRKTEYTLKLLSACILFVGGITLAMSGRIEYIFITVIGATLLMLDIFTRIGVRPWKYR